MYKEIKFQINGDNRGCLVSLETVRNIPFDIKRVYYIYDTKTEVRRGFHAHKNLEQVIICVNGSCELLLDDGKEKTTLELSKKNHGIHIKSMVWREMFNFSSDCVLLVLANEYYVEADYIRNYTDFINAINDA